jgi:hypothetical protein
MAAAVGPSVRRHCGARAGVVPHNSLRAARCAQTDAASMSTKRASAPTPALRCPRRRTNRPCRVPPCAKSVLGLFEWPATAVAAKTVQGRTRCACEAPRR